MRAIKTALAALGCVLLASTSAFADSDLFISIPLLPGNPTATAGSKMQIDRIFENSTIKVEDEASIWPSSTTYTALGVSKEFTASNTSGSGTPATTIFGYAVSNGSTNAVVAVIGDAYDYAGSGNVFGANFIARNKSGVTGSALKGVEIDLEPASGTTISSTSFALALNVFNIATSSPGILFGSVGGGSFLNGIVFNGITNYALSMQSSASSMLGFADSRNGTYTQAAFRLGEGTSQGIEFGSAGSSGDSYLYQDTSHNLTFKVGSGELLAVKANDGSTIALKVTAIDAANSYISLLANASALPQISPDGSATNASVNIKGKGSGGAQIRDGSNNLVVQVNTTGLGFFAATPVAKQTVGAALSTGGSETNANLATRINDLRTALINYGLVQ